MYVSILDVREWRVRREDRLDSDVTDEDMDEAGRL